MHVFSTLILVLWVGLWFIFMRQHLADITLKKINFSNVNTLYRNMYKVTMPKLFPEGIFLEMNGVK